LPDLALIRSQSVDGVHFDPHKELAKAGFRTAALPMWSSLINCSIGWHVFDEDQADASAAASHSTAANANQPTGNDASSNSTATPVLAPVMFTASFDNSACSSVPSDGGSGNIANIVVAEKAIPTSPTLSLLDKTFASSDESSQGDEEAGDVVGPLNVNDECRRRMMMIAKGCTIAVLIVLIPIIVVVGKPMNQDFLEIPVTIEPSSSPSIRPSISPTTTNFPTLQPTSSPSAYPSATPTLSPSMSRQPTSTPSLSPSTYPSADPTLSPSMSREPTSTPSLSPSVSRLPTLMPSAHPSKVPTSTPSAHPSISTQPTSSPSAFPSASPFVLFTFGEALYTDNNLGIQISVGLTARQIAQTGSRVSYANGGQSSIRYHDAMDGAGIAQLPNGGYAYLSNAEEPDGNGGVYGLYFDKDGQITDYKALLTGTSRNCGGGMSPWNTWISCEEYENGQCWQIEPDPNKLNHNSPKATLLGGLSGGEYETVAVDNTNKNKPIFFTTEDKSNGELRRFEADGNGWEALHVGGQTTYLEFLDGNRFQWTSNIDAAKYSAWKHYPNTEGILCHNSTLYFVAKVTRTLFILDLNDMTYTSELTGSSWVGQGSFNSQPDQIIESDLDNRKYIYFTEDGGSAPGVHVRDREGKYYTMVRGVPGGRYAGDESVGIAFSPDRRKFYFGFQDAGVLIEVTRDDGFKFN